MFAHRFSWFFLSSYVSLLSWFHVVMSVTIVAHSVCLNLQLFVAGLMSYLRYLCLLAYSGVQHILCCVFCFVCLPLVFCVPNVANFSGLSILELVFPGIYLVWGVAG